MLLVEKPILLSLFERWIQQLLWEGLGNTSIQVLRVKCLLHLEGKANKYILQGVREIYDIQECDEKWPVDSGSTQTSRIVLIGNTFFVAIFLALLIYC
jgi:G3E family GTPase